MRISIYFILFCLVSTFCFASIEETRSLYEITRQLRSDSSDVVWMLWDIDETLLQPADGFGSPAWYQEQVLFFKLQGLSDELALHRAHEFWNYQFDKIRHDLMESKLRDEILRIQNLGFTTFAFTSRSQQMSPATERQLLDVGISFQNGFFPSANGDNFIHGILYAGLNSKGKVLLDFLKRNKFDPKKIWFVDNNIEHLKDVETHLRELDIEFRGFHYLGPQCTLELKALAKL